MKNMFDKLLVKLHMKRGDTKPVELQEKKNTIGLLNERMNGLERKLNSERLLKTKPPNELFFEMDLMMQDEIRNRERLERKLMRTTRKMDHLAAEFNVLQCQLKTSAIDLDLERRKNAELIKRLNTTNSSHHQIRRTTPRRK